MASRLGYACPYSFHQLIQMAAPWVAIAKGAFNEYLRFVQIRFFPPCANAQRVLFRRKLSHALTD